MVKSKYLAENQGQHFFLFTYGLGHSIFLLGVEAKLLLQLLNVISYTYPVSKNVLSFISPKKY